MPTVHQFYQKFGAGLLAFALIGSVYGLLAVTLISPQPNPASEVAKIQTAVPVMETVTVVGTRRTI